MAENSDEQLVEDTRTMEQKVFELHGKGIGEPTIAKQLGTTRYQVRKILKNPDSTATDNTTDRKVPVSAGSTRLNIKKTAPPPPKDTVNITQGMEQVEKEIMVQASPLIRKVMLNPKIYLWYDYARSELGFRGDIGDFLIDTVEDFWLSRGYKIKIEKEVEIS